MTPMVSGEMPDPPERTGEEAPSGLPDEQAEAPPLGVPADADAEESPTGADAMPGIPTEGEPPTSG